MSENESEEEIKTEAPQAEPIKFGKTEEEKKEDRIAWIRFIVLHVLVLIPAVIGIALLVSGQKSNNDTVTFVGQIVLEAGIPVVMAILIATVLIWKYRSIRKLKEETEVAEDEKSVADETTPSDGIKEETQSQSEREKEAIAAVNNSRGYVSRANMAEYEMNSIAEGMRHAPKWGLPVGLACFFSLFALLIVATVLFIKRIFVGAIICASIFGVVLITTFIVMAVSRAKATNGDIRKAKKITEGTVKACFMIGTTTTSTGGMRNGNGKTVRINSVTYRVIVIADGMEYGAFSKQFYETGEKVTVAVMGKHRAKIVENNELEQADADSEE